jgi:hypothetical protein
MITVTVVAAVLAVVVPVLGAIKLARSGRIVSGVARSR